MKLTLTFTFAFILLQIGLCQTRGASTLIQNVKLTNVPSEDVIEINQARQTLINYIIKQADIKNSTLHKLIRKDYEDPIENGHNSSDKEINYPDKITENNFSLTFIDKSNEIRSSENKKDTLLVKWKLEKNYTFLMTLPYYDGYSHGYGIFSFNYVFKFSKFKEWQEQSDGKEINFKTTYHFFSPKRIDMNYDFLKSENTK